MTDYPRLDPSESTVPSKPDGKVDYQRPAGEPAKPVVPAIKKEEVTKKDAPKVEEKRSTPEARSILSLGRNHEKNQATAKAIQAYQDLVNDHPDTLEAEWC